MRFATLLAAFSAAALVSAASNAGPATEHLALLTKKSDVEVGPHGGLDHDAARKKRHHGMVQKQKRNSAGLKKRAGYCKAKPSSGNSNSGSSSSSSQQQQEPSSSSSSSASPKPTKNTDSGSSSGDDSGSDSGSGSSNSGSGSSSGTANAQLGSISSFQGTNSGIMSWFRTNAGSDSTNGESWCQTRYQDDWKCFAPSVGTMLRNFGGDYNKAATAYCGREVKVTYNGKSTNAFICDGFDDRWVLSPGSIDATIGLFTEVYGSFDNNKNTVGKDVKWEFTGGIVQEGTFKNGKKW